MIIANSTEVKNNFGRYLDASSREPVEVTKSGRRVAILLSTEEYDRLSTLEDAYWGERALAAATGGFIGPEESMRLLTRGHDEKTDAGL